ncbi:FAD-dependent tricarballylate dehydrogenase TcuA [Microterricola pindariensis]|uniref:Tricarballylate dehydrogenase n=1 Tax=Microterricola pindariensis TaxID=478010 RepID=A0ABX5ATY7_9MICO|nr:FAD-dependent tricarballylate dehydrogenase TcuA [Microterricola pindariensis]PPL17197.1 tricarballylate dehydrogenase [Microterricola pindariensis]
MSNRQNSADVIIVGGGNAALTAAIAAATRGRRVRVLERAPKGLDGGNSYYTAGATRMVHNGLDDLLQLVEADDRHPSTVAPPYSAADYTADIVKVTNGRNDTELTRVLVEEIRPTMDWLHSLGMRYRLMYERQAYSRPDGTHLFWGGLHVGNVGGGVGLVETATAIAIKHGVRIEYGMEVTDLIVESGHVVGVRVRGEDGTETEEFAESVILGAGGFEANAEMRRTYLGEGWENAKVRGTPFNTGGLLEAALRIGAARGGDWHSCHSVQWDAFNPENESNRELTNRLTRQSYPLGIIVNKDGRRFLDEGEDFRNYTYAKYGKVILQQPDSTAWQIFDASLRPLLRSEEYDMPGISVTTADSIAELAAAIGVPVESLVMTVNEYNASIDTSIPLDHNVKDGRAARVEPPKSNWAAPLSTGPFYAYGVTCGITFTFGGLKSDIDGRVLDESGTPIPSLFVCGEMLGGLFSDNYPGGSGLAAGMVFGRRAGMIA